MSMSSFDIPCQKSYHGKHIKSEGTSHRLTKTKTGDIKKRFTVGMSSGLGFQAVMEPQGVIEVLSQGTFRHAGAYATHIAGAILLP